MPAEMEMNNVPSEGTLAILDTNVFIDVHSCHDLIDTFDGLHATVGNAAIEDPAVTYRLARARESVLLVIYLNKIGATTFNLHSEAVEMLMRSAPPAPGGTSMKSDFTTVFLHFVKDYVLPDWSPTMPTEPGTEAKNEADAALIECAKKHNLPLITNEGYTPKGLVEIKMRKLAREAGVQVFAPREFYAGKIDEAEEIAAFLQRFREHAPGYLKERNQTLGPDQMGKVLGWIIGYYRMILLGVVEGRDTPVRVTL
jgi:hypothetical protein